MNKPQKFFYEGVDIQNLNNFQEKKSEIIDINKITFDDKFYPQSSYDYPDIQTNAYIHRDTKNDYELALKLQEQEIEALEQQSKKERNNLSHGTVKNGAESYLFYLKNRGRTSKNVQTEVVDEKSSDEDDPQLFDFENEDDGLQLLKSDSALKTKRMNKSLTSNSDNSSFDDFCSTFCCCFCIIFLVMFTYIIPYI